MWQDESARDAENLLAIRRSLSWARLKGEEIRPRYFPPKTKAGRRVIQIPDELVAGPEALETPVPEVR
jgi:hypothetical protein